MHWNTLATKAELDAVRFILDKEWPDGTTSDSVARAAIKALDDLRSTAWRPLTGLPALNDIFKPQWSSKTHFVRWIGDERGRQLAWMVTDDSDVGSITHVTSPLWRFTKPAGRISQEKIDSIAVNTLGVLKGDRLSIKNVGNFTVEEVFSRGVLLRFQDGILWGESNHDLQRYYKDGWI